jgi:glycosyltransferase involved in cell wall biosynthesis
VLQQRVLRDCALVIAASDEIADALVRDHRIARPVAIYNTPPRECDLPPKSGEFSLYWRNYQIGFGQRGLEDAFVALSKLPEDVTLHVQGKLPFDGGEQVRKRAEELRISHRLVIDPPFAQGEAVRRAAPHTIGLCLERRGPANHEYTVSNKMFDYHMAGLAVVASDLPSLRHVIERSGGGELFEPGSPDSLAAVILGLYNDRSRTQGLAERARSYALHEGNDETEMSRFTTAFENAVHGVRTGAV